MEPISLSEYRRTPGLSVPYIVHRMIPEKSRIMLNGPNKAGKSFLGLQLALAIAKGENFLGRATRKCTVVYLQFDTPDPIWKDRLDDLEVNGVQLSDNIVFAKPGTVPRPFNIMDDSHRIQLDRFIYRTDPQIVFIDVLRKIHNLDENKSGDMKRVFDVLNVVFGDRALFMMHHTAKAGSGEDGDKDKVRIPRASEAGRGSGFIGGECDANWLLWPLGGGRGTLSIDSRFDEEITLGAVRDPETSLWVFPEEADFASVGERLIQLCDEFPHLSHYQLADVAKQRFQLSRSAYYRRMSGLKCRHSPKLLSASSVAASDAHPPRFQSDLTSSPSPHTTTPQTTP